MYRTKLLITVLISMYVVGCYTIIQHPKLSESVIQEKEFFDENVLYIDDCSRCHDSYYPYRSSYVETYHAMPHDFDYYKWEFFYDIPWWQELNYYEAPAGMSDSEILPPTQKRNFNRRDDSFGNSAVSSPSSNQGPSSLSKESSTSGQSSESGSTNSGKRGFSRRDSGNDSASKPKSKPQIKNSKPDKQKQD